MTARGSSASYGASGWAPVGGAAALRRLGRINFRCDESKGRYRVEQVIESIEVEYEMAQKRGDKRVMIEILTNSFRIIR